ncbi:MAG: hypothetical protein JW811_10550 [Clostridiales bacterium]|nr:hypothetical protein [Clostridiales bacterium]
MKTYRYAAIIIAVTVILLSAVSAAYAVEDDIFGLWQYREIVTREGQKTGEASVEEAQGVLLSDLEAMPLGLLGKVFGKLNYTAEFTREHRFALNIRVLGMRFSAQGDWSAQDGRMTLIYDEITGFESLWWLGGFAHLSHCDAEHTMIETVPYAEANDTLTFRSNGADLIFDRE